MLIMKLLPILSIVITLSSGSLAWYGFGKRRLAQNEPTRKTKGDVFEEQWFSQMLDHYDPSATKMWKQRYFVNDQFYKEGGPIFLMISGEQVAQPAWIVDDASLEAYLAKKLGAKLFFLEHRFYGRSRPTMDLSTYSLAFLSADQALADTAYFIEGMQRSHNIPRSSKWILFGASYAGSLVSWMRAKYPHLVHGAVANSAPLVAEIDFKDFYIVVESSLRKHSPNCVNVLRQAYKSVHSMLADKLNRQKLENIFNICGSHFEENTVINDIINFYEGIIDITTEVVFNNDTYSLTIEKACSVLEDEKKGEPLARLALVNKLLLEERGQNCLPLEKYNDTINKLKQISWPDGDQWDRRWIYQVCTEFGWFQSTSGKPFDIPISAIPIELYTRLCTDTFGARFKKMLILGVERTNLQFGGLDIADSVSNIAFIHGSNDPWHAAGVVNSTNPRSPVIYVEGAGHCPLIHPPRKTDNPPLAEGKQKVEKLIDLWLNRE